MSLAEKIDFIFANKTKNVIMRQNRQNVGMYDKVPVKNWPNL
jgi:hypothetical protein